MIGHVRIGVSGWTYPPWRGNFYPRGLRQKDELGFLSRALTSIEINGSFYALQKPDSYARWCDETPDDFVFSVKAPRYITHIRRLQDPHALLGNFLASGPLRLGAKLGPILWQLPPSFRLDAGRIAAFLAALPHDTEAAAAMAATHDARVSDAWTKTDAARPLRHAIEVRHDSFKVPEFIDMLRHHGVAVVCADTVEWPCFGDLTADFVYCRLHGDAARYVGGYDAASIAAWATRIRRWTEGSDVTDLPQTGDHAAKRPRDVFLYFDNTTKTRAPFDATALIDRLKEA